MNRRQYREDFLQKVSQVGKLLYIPFLEDPSPWFEKLKLDEKILVIELFLDGGEEEEVLAIIRFNDLLVQFKVDNYTTPFYTMCPNTKGAVRAFFDTLLECALSEVYDES